MPAGVDRIGKPAFGEPGWRRAENELEGEATAEIQRGNRNNTILRHHGERLLYSGSRRRYARGFRGRVAFCPRVESVRGADYFSDAVSRNRSVRAAAARGAPHSRKSVGALHAFRYQFRAEEHDRG